MGYKVSVIDEVRTLDIPALQAIEPDVLRVVAELVRDLHSDPWLGAEMRERMRMDILKDCRKISFDLPTWKDKKRFRMVYRNDPNDGAVAVISVLSVGPRQDLAAYKQAATRLGRQQREVRPPTQRL